MEWMPHSRCGNSYAACSLANPPYHSGYPSLGILHSFFILHWIALTACPCTSPRLSWFKIMDLWSFLESWAMWRMNTVCSKRGHNKRCQWRDSTWRVDPRWPPGKESLQVLYTSGTKYVLYLFYQCLPIRLFMLMNADIFIFCATLQYRYGKAITIQICPYPVFRFRKRTPFYTCEVLLLPAAKLIILPLLRSKILRPNLSIRIPWADRRWRYDIKVIY